MSFFRREPDRPAAINLGRNHETEAEIHYSSGTDDWWYHGHLWLTETRPVRRRDIDPVLTDPRNRRILREIRQGWTDEQIAERIVQESKVAARTPWPVKPGGEASDSDPGETWTAEEERNARARARNIARKVRVAAELADEDHSLRIYGLGTATKTDERILVTVDQDLIAEAPQIPYTQTEKGSRRKQQVIGAFGAVLYVFLLLWTFWSLPTSPATVSSFQAAESQMVSLGAIFGLLAAFASVGPLVYFWTIRRVRVLDVQIQPVWPSIVQAHSEAVFLVNTKKRPASDYLTHVFSLPTEAVRELSEEIGRFQSDLISSLQGQAASFREELDNAQIQLSGERLRKFNRELLGPGAPPVAGSWNPWAIALLVTIAVVVTGVGVYAAVLAGG
jgi:hypothetical protein